MGNQWFSGLTSLKQCNEFKGLNEGSIRGIMVLKLGDLKAPSMKLSN